MKALQIALKPRYVRMDELVCNRGLDHLALKIFRHLDRSDLVSCLQVSKAWNEFISNDFNSDLGQLNQKIN